MVRYLLGFARLYVLPYALIYTPLELCVCWLTELFVSSFLHLAFNVLVNKNHAPLLRFVVNVLHAEANLFFLTEVTQWSRWLFLELSSEAS